MLRQSDVQSIGQIVSVEGRIFNAFFFHLRLKSFKKLLQLTRCTTLFFKKMLAK